MRSTDTTATIPTAASSSATISTPPTRAIPTAATGRTRASVRTLGVGLAIGTGIAVVANLVVFAIADIGAPVQVATGGDPKVADLDLGSVMVASVAWLVIGAIGLWVSQRLFRRGLAIWVTGAALITVASVIPAFAMDVDTGSKVALTVMHVVVAIAAVTGQVVAGRRAA